MELIYLYKGLILGFSVAAPVGPIGVLCINRTINKGYVSGIISGLGAATADLIYGLIAGLGLTVISNTLIENKLLIQSVGLLFLFYLGIKTLLKKQRDFETEDSKKSGLFKDYLTTFMLTITNPVTILFFLAVFAGLGLTNSQNNNLSTILLVLGVFSGSGFWWIFLSGLTYKLKNKISKKIFKKIDFVSGIIILVFGLFILYDLINELS